MSTFTLTFKEKAILEQMHRSIKDWKKRDRIKTVLFLDRGFSYVETSELLLLDRDTIYKIQKKFKKDWINKFLDDNYICYTGKLSEAEIQKVEKFVEESFIWDSKEIIDFIQDNFWRKYTSSWITKLLHRIGFTYKKTKHIPAKANKEKQEAFIEEYKKCKEELNKDEKILFLDWVHPLHNSHNWYCWIKKGTEKEIKSNTGRERININGVYCVETQEVTIITSEKINAQSTIELYKKIENKYSKMSTIFIVRDNARYYNNKLVKEYLKTSRIKEMPMPPYSPNLNSIERLWHYFKREVTYNKYYEKFADFEDAVLYFFSEWFSQHKKKLSTFVTDNFRSLGT